jgi:hypothetical protein
MSAKIIALSEFRASRGEACRGEASRGEASLNMPGPVAEHTQRANPGSFGRDVADAHIENSAATNRMASLRESQRGLLLRATGKERRVMLHEFIRFLQAEERLST